MQHTTWPHFQKQICHSPVVTTDPLSTFHTDTQFCISHIPANHQCHALHCFIGKLSFKLAVKPWHFALPDYQKLSMNHCLHLSLYYHNSTRPCLGLMTCWIVFSQWSLEPPEPCMAEYTAVNDSEICRDSSSAQKQNKNRQYCY